MFRSRLEKKTASRGSPSMPAASGKSELDRQVQEDRPAKGVVRPREGIAVAEDGRVRESVGNDRWIPVKQVVDPEAQGESLAEGPGCSQVEIVSYAQHAVGIRRGVREQRIRASRLVHDLA